MNFPKINPYLAGIALVFAGSAVLYYQEYRNIEWINTVGFLAVIAGWTVIYIRLIKNTPLDKKDSEMDWVGRLTSLGATLVTLAVAFGNIYLIYNLAHQRKLNMLNNGNTAITTATIDRIQVRRSRNSSSYYAIFRYTVNGKLVEHPWYEKNETDFIIGDKYEVKYVINHPEMIMILSKMNN